MIAKPLAVFRADFPDDQVEDARNIVLLGGRNVAEAIGQLLRDGGCEVSGIEYDDPRGWAFFAKFQGEVFNCQTTSFYPRFFFDIYGPPRNPHKLQIFTEFTRLVDTALRDDGRFHDVQWYLRKDAPDPWGYDEDSPAPIDLEAAARTKAELRRERLRERRAGCGCWVAPLALLVAIFGLYAAVGGLARLAAGASDGAQQTAIGVVIFVVGAGAVWALTRLALGQRR